MRRILMIAAAFSLAFGAMPALAQDGQMDPKAMEEMMIKLATPGAQHALLAGLAGEWKTEMNSYMGGPEPIHSTGHCTYESVFGGRYLVGRYTGEAMGQPFEGMSIDGYDNSAKQFFSMWIDNFGTGYYLAHGALGDDGKTLRHSGTMTFGPMEMATRSETVFVDENTIRFTMWHTMGGQEMKAMDLTYTREK